MKITLKIVENSVEFGNKQKSIGQQNKEKIVSCLLEGYPKGKSTSELVKITGLHRDTIYTLCKDLTTNRGIVVKKEGKFGKYMLTAKALKDPGLSGLLFSKYAYDKIMSRHVSVNENIPSNMSDEERMLFEFITKIGAFITYAMLEALQLDNHKLAIDIFDNTSTKNNASTTLNDKQRNDVRHAWVHGAIQPDRIFLELFDALKSLSGSSSEMNNKSVSQRLTEAFCTLYPNIFNELEKLRKNMPGEIEGVLERRKQ
jgi:hypothetical protein